MRSLPPFVRGCTALTMHAMRSIWYKRERERGDWGAAPGSLTTTAAQCVLRLWVATAGVGGRGVAWET